MAEGGTRVPRLLRVPDVVRMLGIPAWRIYELVAERKIPHMRVGRTLRFSEVALAAWIEEQHAGEAAS